MQHFEFSTRTRTQDLKNHSAQPPKVYDAVVVGGGIVGAGLLRELAIRGVSALLVEKSDFASGTSSKSSKLIHGGLRYLEMFDFHLVFEALSERHWLIETHPHLVHPLEFNLPIYKMKNAPPKARSSTLLGAGLWLYDTLSLFRTPFFHGKHDANQTTTLFPQLRKEGLKGSYFYADAMMLDDEMVLEVLADALKRGAKAMNYVKAEHVSERKKNGLYEVELSDQLTGQNKFTVHAKEVIVCVGPWTEKISGHIAQGSNKKLKPSKGVHLILPWKKFPIQECLVMYAPDGRIVFAIPRKDFGEGAELVIVGTTDSPERGDLDAIYASKKDVEYLISVVSEYFPESKITQSDVVMTYAGVRPLIDDGAESEAKTSREHEIWKNNAGIVFMAGGKYTTFRKISKEIADFAFPKSYSADQESKALLSHPDDYVKRFTGKHLWGKYTEGWLKWKLAHHCPCTLEDIVFRRIPAWLLGKDLDNKLLDNMANIAQEYFQWSEEEKQKQVEQVKSKIAANLKF